MLSVGSTYVLTVQYSGCNDNNNNAIVTLSLQRARFRKDILWQIRLKFCWDMHTRLRAGRACDMRFFGTRSKEKPTTRDKLCSSSNEKLFSCTQIVRYFVVCRTTKQYVRYGRSFLFLFSSELRVAGLILHSAFCILHSALQTKEQYSSKSTSTSTSTSSLTVTRTAQLHSNITKKKQKIIAFLQSQR